MLAMPFATDDAPSIVLNILSVQSWIARQLAATRYSAA
jgi:hypothetical protein